MYRIKLFFKIGLYYFYRKFKIPRLLPVNLTISLTNRCNSRCKTCNVYHRKFPELTKTDWIRIFDIYGSSVEWITFSGGEPFLYNDIVEVVCSAYEKCRPRFINIPTNGILHNIIPEKVKQISEVCKNTNIIINISIDEVGEKHDEIRNAKGCYKKALLTYENLRALNCTNVTIGIHTVISKFNYARFPQIYESIQDIKPDSYITEIAEERVELGTVGKDITPSVEEYEKAIDFLCGRLRKQSFKGVARIIQSLRVLYYDLVKRTLREQRQIIPCYAGFASAQIAPNGDVWMCCIKAEPIGNLKEVNFDFRKIWFSEKANRIRKDIINGSCYCPLANTAYINMILNPRIMSKVAINLLRK
jgi:MoaA/NifB/PqqE/SkfB family radical SAM enzyme